MNNKGYTLIKVLWTMAVLAVALANSTFADDVRGLYQFDDSAFSTPAVNDDSPRVTLAATGRRAENGNYEILLTATLAPDWHLYSITQPDKGPVRTEITIDAALIVSIRPLTAPHVEPKSVFGVPVESYADRAAWLITVHNRNALPNAAPTAGRLTGQVCNEGLGGVCIQIDEQFTIDDTAPVDWASVSEEAARVAPQFCFASTKSTTSTKSVQYEVTELEEVSSLGGAMFWAFLGGLLLNVMPCVLPVIGLKILSFFQQAGESRVRAFTLNVFYTLGLLTVFALLATMSVGLSYLFTFDVFNIVMAAVVFAMALSLMGIWELTLPSFLTGGTASQMLQREGWIGAYFKGIITTLLAIPCGAPMLSPALGWASVQMEAGEAVSVFAVYLTIGLGMASPFLVMGAFPELLRFLPKPGAWMDTFRKVMGFGLLGAVIWILYFVPLAQGVPTVAFLFAIWFACWLVGRLDFTAPASAWWRAYGIGAVVCAATVVGVFNFPGNPNSFTLQNAMAARLERGVPEDIQAKIDAALARGQIVAVDFTADWCLNCKVLDATVLQSREVQDAFAQHNVVLIHADCTRRDLPGSVLLRSLGVESVPTLAIFRPQSPNAPLVIRGNYFAKTLIEKL
ncbi:MAG: cytochrome c biogenesis protein CcdA [Thermoguttaceae bacterium]